ncbi:hypothetical protein ACFQO9_02450 [Chryseobacterium zhengzhouense]|uniref:Uncharacterized protein n=1 Tax=Chryseobacterium zhengzhouense TaxID=1636086 RepID=A0ABW2LY43_9FLAO
MHKDFIQSDWQEADGHKKLVIPKETEGKHIIQVFEKNADDIYSPIEPSIEDDGKEITLRGSIAFDGYVVYK